METMIRERKQALRSQVLRGRSALDHSSIEAFGSELAKQLVQLTTEQSARSLTCFLPIRNEPDTTEFLEWARSCDIDVLLPSVQADSSLDWIRPVGDATVEGRLGTLEPLGERLGQNAPRHVDLMLIPAAAVDRQGNRLGWGKGFYDRSLATLETPPPTFAVIYDEEFVDEIPAEPHDHRVSGVVTPSRIVRF